jgi:hypothetical protein
MQKRPGGDFFCFFVLGGQAQRLSLGLCYILVRPFLQKRSGGDFFCFFVFFALGGQAPRTAPPTLNESMPKGFFGMWL